MELLATNSFYVLGISELENSLSTRAPVGNRSEVQAVRQPDVAYRIDERRAEQSADVEWQSTPEMMSGMQLVPQLYYYYMAFCVCIGLIGNTMVWILIRSNRMLSKLPTNTYLLCLASMSSIFLANLLVFYLEENVLQNSPLWVSNLICMLTNYGAHVADFASVWLIVLVGFERLILLYRKSRSLTLERARAQTVVLLVLALLLNTWILFVAQVDENGICDTNPHFMNLYNTMTLVEAIVCMALPSIAIIISNCLVVYKLHEHLRRNPGSPSVSFNTGDTADLVLTTTNSNSHTLKSYTRASLGRLSSRFSIEVEKKPKPIKRKGLRYQDIQLTRSLLLVTWVFIILNLPNYIYRILQVMYESSFESDMMQKILLIPHVLLYTHHAFLFYLYIFYSPQMRRKLKPTALKLIECYCFKPADFSEHT